MNKTSTLCIDAGTLYTPQERISSARILIHGSTIKQVGSVGNLSIPLGSTHIDALPLTAAPGFIEPHIHGCGGVDVMDGELESLKTISRTLARHGTTSFLATTVSAPTKILGSVIRKLGGLLGESFEGARPLGIHLEGPFINSSCRGTHKEEHICAPDPDLFEEWFDISGSAIRLVTLAPEVDGAGSIIARAKQRGITVAMGHSNAAFSEAESAASRGVCYAVHTFNAMREFKHRDPGIIGAVLSDDRIFAEIIADGIHVHPSVVKLFSRAKKAERIVLVTDAMSATDMPDGKYPLGIDTVIVRDGACHDAEGRLAGSTLTQEKALANFIEWTGFSLGDALRTLTLNPATALGFDHKGRVEPGADADITLMDENYRVVKTFVAGKLVFDRDLWTN